MKSEDLKGESNVSRRNNDELGWVIGFGVEQKTG